MLAGTADVHFTACFHMHCCPCAAVGAELVNVGTVHLHFHYSLWKFLIRSNEAIINTMHFIILIHSPSLQS